MTRWWDSIATMQCLSRMLTSMAVMGFLVGIGSWAIAPAVAIVALVVATCAVLGALFTWFRLDHLRELERFGR
jgi:hypothetical protein